MQNESYVQLILALAPLLVVALALRAIDFVWPRLGLRITLALAGLLFAVSFSLSPGLATSFLTLPWMLFTIFLAWRRLGTWWQKKQWRPEKLCYLAAFLYLPTGAFWAFADRMGIQPMGFSPIIVLLTGVHFHFAGFALPLVTALILEQQKQRWWTATMAIGIILGIPLVALGISTSQYDLPFFIEIIAVTIMASAGFAVGLLYMIRAFKQQSWRRYLFFAGGLALSLGMCLALAYGWRYIFPISYLTIPWMYAVHGSLNSLGFTLPVLLAWNLEEN